MTPSDDFLVAWLLCWLLLEGAMGTEGVIEEAHNAWKLHHWRMVHA